jgi:hypothetical protein
MSVARQLPPLPQVDAPLVLAGWASGTEAPKRRLPLSGALPFR